MGAVGGVATPLDLKLGVSLIPKDAREIADLSWATPFNVRLSSRVSSPAMSTAMCSPRVETFSSPGLT